MNWNCWLYIRKISVFLIQLSFVRLNFCATLCLVEIEFLGFLMFGLFAGYFVWVVMSFDKTDDHAAHDAAPLICSFDEFDD